MADETPTVTVTVRGLGGDEFDLDVPEEGTIARDRFDADIADGTLVIIAGDVAASTTATPAPTSKRAPRKPRGKADDAVEEVESEPELEDAVEVE
jgi:hypothetical protein